MKRLRLILLLVSCLLFMAGGAFAQTDTETLTINATVGARAKLTMNPTTINFPDADPDDFPLIDATENPVDVEAKVRTTGTATLTCQANGDLISGGDSIAISNVTWTATGGGYQAGTMSSATPQTAGSFVGSGEYDGTFSYQLANSWAYEVGNYSQTVTYTLTAP